MLVWHRLPRPFLYLGCAIFVTAILGLAMANAKADEVEVGLDQAQVMKLPAGVATIVARAPVAPSEVRPGDVVILSGDVGRHGMAVMAARDSLGFESEIVSDCAPLAGPVLALIEAGIRIHCLRDLTRGGLASALVEIAETDQILTVAVECVPMYHSVNGILTAVGKCAVDAICT